MSSDPRAQPSAEDFSNLGIAPLLALPPAGGSDSDMGEGDAELIPVPARTEATMSALSAMLEQMREMASAVQSLQAQVSTMQKQRTPPAQPVAPPQALPVPTGAPLALGDIDRGPKRDGEELAGEQEAQRRRLTLVGVDQPAQ